MDESLRLAIRYVPIDALTPYMNNARTHSDAQVAQIAASIREFGWTNAILVDGERGIIAGHARAAAAKKLGMAEVPTIELAHLTPAQRKAYIIADNKLALNAGWNDDLLRLEFEELKALDYNLELTGFGSDELTALFADRTAGNTDPDDVPDLQPNPITEPGDVWLLGNHRLVAGDSTDADTVAKALNGVKPHLMTTDPPYGVGYDPGWRIGVKATHNTKRNTAQGKVENDACADWRDAWALFPGDVAYVWHGALHAPAVADGLSAAGFGLRAHIVWDKGRIVFGRGHYHWQHEACWYAVKAGSAGHWSGDRKQSTVWQLRNSNAFGGDKSEGQSGHGTQKPVECMKRPIENNSSPGQAVYEPFAGSFTTGIACEMTGRVCHAIELSPNYCDVGIRRWQAFTGREATLESDGRTFAEVEASKAPQPAQAAE